MIGKKDLARLLPCAQCSYLGHLLPVGLGVQGGLCEQGGVLFWCYPQLIVEGVVPDLVGTKAREAEQASDREQNLTGPCVLEEDSQELHGTVNLERLTAHVGGSLMDVERIYSFSPSMPDREPCLCSCLPFDPPLPPSSHFLLLPSRRQAAPRCLLLSGSWLCLADE